MITKKFPSTAREFFVYLSTGHFIYEGQELLAVLVQFLHGPCGILQVPFSDEFSTVEH